MQNCNKEAVWKAVCKKELIVRTSINEGYYCNSCKKYQQRINDRWNKFDKIHSFNGG